jgi:hypothetical protein
MNGCFEKHQPFGETDPVNEKSERIVMRPDRKTF